MRVNTEASNGNYEPFLQHSTSLDSNSDSKVRLSFHNMQNLETIENDGTFEKKKHQWLEKRLYIQEEEEEYEIQ